MALVYLGIGSNLDNRFENIRMATLKLLSFGKIKNSSSVWKTSPWGFTSQNSFLNCVVLFETIFSPFQLLQEISKIEQNLGRKRTQRFGPRTVDIDILFYNALIVNTPNLTIPHPHLHKRKFVLLPLSEIAQNLMHPVLKKKINELLRDLNSKEDCNLFMPVDKFLDITLKEYVETGP